MLSELDLDLADYISQFRNDPLGFVLAAFEWGVGTLEGFEGPDSWQVDVLTEIGNRAWLNAFDGYNPTDPVRLSVASGHGVGKSALTAWLTLWILSTRPDAKGSITANTGDQLRTKTMGELAKWHRLCITRHWFEMSAMSIHHRTRGDTWRADALTSREENSEAFAGQHNSSSTSFYIFDEASAIPEKIWEVAEGGLTDGEPFLFCFGNPTRNSGSFFNTFGKLKHRWATYRVDSRTAKMTNKRLIKQWEADHGDDSDFFRVRVRGMFPRASDMQFMPSDVVHDAMKRGPGRYLGTDPLICGVDIARGGDDNCRIVFRRGKDCKSEKSYMISGEKSRDSTRVISLLLMLFERHKPDVTFLDETGIGGPILDRLCQLGYHVIGVHFGGKADQDKLFKNRTAEMGYRCRRWLMDGGAIPDDPDLETELTTREFWHDDKDRLVLERKPDLKKRLGISPDWADALYLTFAHVVPDRSVPRGTLDHIPGQRGKSREYDPLAAMDDTG